MILVRWERNRRTSEYRWRWGVWHIRDDEDTAGGRCYTLCGRRFPEPGATWGVRETREADRPDDDVCAVCRARIRARSNERDKALNAAKELAPEVFARLAEVEGENGRLAAEVERLRAVAQEVLDGAGVLGNQVGFPRVYCLRESRIERLRASLARPADGGTEG